MGRCEKFTKFRQDMNARILAEGPLEIKRFFAPDERTYEAGAPPASPNH